MVVCRFFQQGNCKFGTSCRNEHPSGDSTGTWQATPDVTVLVSSVQADNLNAEKGGQWLLTSYAPFKEKPAIPGFEDKSFEEVRYEFYQAKIAGQIDQYNQQMQALYQSVLAKIRALQNPTPDVINMIKQIYNSPPNYGSTTNSIFGGTQAPQAPVSSIFGGQTTIQPVGNFTGGSIFGGSTQNQSSPFGTQASTPFGQASSSPFGAPQATTNSPFGVPQSTTNSPFGAAQPTTNSPFGTPQVATNTPFGVAQAVTASPFGVTQPASNSPFGVPQPARTNYANNPIDNQPFGATQTPTPSPFGVPQNTGNSPFGVPQSTPFYSGPFGGTPFQNAAPPGNSLNPSGASASLYSKMEDLDEENLAMFQSAKFEPGKIPEKPPPYELC